MASASLTAVSTPNVSRSADALSDDFIQNECRRCHWMIHRSSLMRSRSRRPLSVDDVRVAEAFLVDSSLDNLSESYDEEFCVFPPLPHSLSSSFSHSEGTSKSSLDVTSTPSPQRDLQSCLEDATLVSPPSPSMEVLFGEINEDVGASWRKLGRHLLKRECVLNNIDADFSGVGEKAYQVLLKWKEENGTTATPRSLFLAMIQIKRTDVAKKLIKLVPSLISLSYLLDSVLPSGCILYYCSSKLNPENLEVKKILQSQDEKVLVCSNSETSQRFAFKQIENEENAFAVRKCIECKALRQQQQCLRKTEQFLKDLQMKQNMVQELLDVIQHLQNHLHTQHQAISQQQFSCQNCGQYRIKQDLVENELTLLHHELQRMIQGNRRISISGIPAERIYNLATRTYTVCEEHREMHARSRNWRSMCQHPEDPADSDDSDDHLDRPLMCALNVIWKIARRRKVTQSLQKPKKSSGDCKIKLTKANSNPLSSDRSHLVNRQSYFLAQENPVTMPSLHTPGDWSGVPAFKMSSDFKKPSSSSNSSRCLFQHVSHSKDRQNPAAPRFNKNEQLIPLQWLKGLEPDELII